MLKRLYANNYRCLVNFEINFDKLVLLLGPNGCGKTTIFDLLYNIQSLLVHNAKVGDVFPSENFTAWIEKNDQSFEIDVQGDEGLYCYKLNILYNPEINKQRIDSELLYFNGKPLFEFKRGEVQLYHDDHKQGPSYSFDWSVSTLATVVPRSDNKKLTWFKNWIDRLFIINIDPRTMISVAQNESQWLDRDAENFASWYSHISQEHQDKIFTLTEQLRDTIPGFHAFKLEQAGRYRILKVGFNNGNESTSSIHYFDFEQISDGQRVLIVLYSLLLGLRDLGITLFIDEPENYVSLPEIQPWLMELNDACGEGFPQAVLISHHPELIDYLGPECGKWIDREPGGPSRVMKMPEKIGEGLKLSEQVARGWTE